MAAQPDQEGRPRLFRRPRHLDHPEVAADRVRRGGGDLHRRPRPGRGAGAGARQGAAAGHQAREHLHRGPARGVRPRLRLPDVPRQHGLRGPVPAGHLDRPAADRQDARSRSPARSAPTPSVTAPPARATTRSASSSATTRWSPTSTSSPPGASGTSRSREALLDFAEKHQIPIAKDKRGEAPVQRRRQPAALLLRGQGAGGPGGRGARVRPQRTIAPEDAPDKPTVFTIDFEHGDPVAIDGEALSPAALLTQLNQLGHDNGVGRLDLVENRFVGMKSRGVYETPGGTILLAAHRGIESHHARPRRHAPEGRADAALRGADLQRLLVRARARDAAGRHRPQPGAWSPAGCG